MPIEIGARGRWGWLLVVGCLGVLALRARPATADHPGDADVPSGTVVFLVGDSQVCPTGWRAATETAGRLAVAVTTADTVGKQVGAGAQERRRPDARASVCDHGGAWV